MKLEAFDNDCGVIFINDLEDIYKIAKFGDGDDIKDYFIEKEDDLITITYATVNGKQFKFAMYEDIFDLGLSTKPSSYIYLGGHTKIDAVFSEGQSYPIAKIKEDGSIVLKAEDGKKYSIPQKFIDMYFEPSSEQSRFEKIKNDKATQVLESESIDMEPGMMSDTEEETFM